MPIFRPLLLFTILALSAEAQQREASPLVYEKSYSYTAIHKSLRDLVNQNDKAVYFRDEFFNAMLKKVLEDKQFTAEEKVKVFYLMLQKIGYAFAGVEYIPPKLNYFTHHVGKIYVLEKTAKSLAGTAFPAGEALRVMQNQLTGDPLLAGNALLLATLLNKDSVLPHLSRMLDTGIVLASGMPIVLNHYLCMSASIAQNDSVSEKLRILLQSYRNEEMLEDVLCALYTRSSPVTPIQKYILTENDPTNDLAIQTSLNALAFRVPEATYKRSVAGLALTANHKWKEELLKKMSQGKIPHNYSLSSGDALVTKAWNGVVVSQYLNGTLISIGQFMEFDPN